MRVIGMTKKAAIFWAVLGIIYIGYANYTENEQTRKRRRRARDRRLVPDSRGWLHYAYDEHPRTTLA